MSTDTMTTPRIYVASLTDYNAGILHGEWIDATQDAEDIAHDIEQMLAASPTAKREGQPAEEYAIHDFEGFGPIRLAEYDAIEHVAGIAAFLAEADEPDAVAAWIKNDESVADASDADPGRMAEAFADTYRGRWSSVGDYAAELLDDLGVFVPAEGDRTGQFDMLVRYFDFDAFARDMVMGGDIWTAPADGGDVFIFDANA